MRKMNMRINEIYYSLQGESSWSGLPCIFIRLQGCNLRCKFCDTEYAQDMKQGVPMTVEDVLNTINEMDDCKLIEFTGGEPMLQADEVAEIIRALDGQGHTFLIETNGSYNPNLLKKKIPPHMLGSVHFIMDIKLPSSGMCMPNHKRNLTGLGVDDETKFVIGTKEDLAMAKRLVKAHRPPNPIFGCVFNSHIPLKEIANYIINNNLDVRLQVQLHKLVWGIEKRGV